MSIEEKVVIACKEAVNKLFSADVNGNQIQTQKTRKDFKGDLTLIVFPLLKVSKKSPEETARLIGDYMVENLSEVSAYNVVKGFLNLEVQSDYWLSVFNDINKEERFGVTGVNSASETVMVEYSSPNTNKPLHLGHIRNNLLGHAICEILKANGKKVVKTNIVNDRGIHICKSMLAWKKWGNGATPESTGKKGDHLIGDYYVLFDKEYKKQVAELVGKGKTKEEAEKEAPLLLEAQNLLRLWESGDEEIYELWKTMNQWVYEGFDVTYKRLGITFDKIYYESDTYLTGKETALEGLKSGILYQRDDNSVWADLTGDGLDEKLLLRSDGTSVYMTQDIGTAQLRQKDYDFSKCVYVVGNEQEYHFKVLSIILDKLGFEWAKSLYHLSYGMVELPEGKMKSREGTVVDADDLIDEMENTAREMSEELGKLDEYSEEEKKQIYNIIGLGALKYFILKVDPKRNMVFNPKESIDFNGNTGPFIQYTYARINSLKRKAGEQNVVYDANKSVSNIKIEQKEVELIKLINDFPNAVKDAGNNYNPAIIANFIYDFVKEYNQYYHEFQILKCEQEETRNFRLALSFKVGEVIKTGMGLLGIDVPERM